MHYKLLLLSAFMQIEVQSIWIKNQKLNNVYTSALVQQKHKIFYSKYLK